jgi:hypothetical protein
MALTNYRAAEQKWPTRLDQVNDTDETVVFKDENNMLVFGPLLADRRKPYLDPSALLTKVNGRVMPLRKAMEEFSGRSDFPIGYPDPSNGNIFRFFKVTFDLSLDTVSVGR